MLLCWEFPLAFHGNNFKEKNFCFLSSGNGQNVGICETVNKVITEV